MSKIYSNQIERTRQLLAGLKNNINLMRDKGVDEAFLNQLEADCNLAYDYNKENEKLKEELRAKTIRANAKLNEIKARAKDAKQAVKRNFDKEKWIKFGVIDKR